MNVCKTCKWSKLVTVTNLYLKVVVEEQVPFCGNPNNVDPVTGKVQGMVACRGARSVNGFCGREGKYWEGE